MANGRGTKLAHGTAAAAVLGSEPQDLKFKGGATRLIVGDDNVFREFCTINRATIEGEERNNFV